MSRLTSHTLQHNGITTSYYDEGTGPVLLLVHGFTGGKLDFHDQVTYFSDRCRVIVPDNRGHGETTNTGRRSDYTLETLVDDLHSFIQTLGLSDVHLLGHSLGGMVAMRYALTHPGNLSSLILMDTSATPLNVPADYFSTMADILQEKGPQALVTLM
ncbi:MAG: alpha/beta hydrolase, partial [Pseudomonadales bacterium]|nr:alpha/beta hydrolase [Pseudomonadales bacterium]